MVIYQSEIRLSHFDGFRHIECLKETSKTTIGQKLLNGGGINFIRKFKVFLYGLAVHLRNTKQFLKNTNPILSDLLFPSCFLSLWRHVSMTSIVDCPSSLKFRRNQHLTYVIMTSHVHTTLLYLQGMGEIQIQTLCILHHPRKNFTWVLAKVYPRVTKGPKSIGSIKI